MDEKQNQGGPNQVPPQEPIPTAVQPQANQQPQQPVVMQTPQQPATPPMYAPIPEKSKKGLHLIFGALLAIFLVVIVVVYLFVFSAAAQANKASVAFMNAAVQGDGAKLAELTDDDSEDGKSFLDNVADSLKGEYKFEEKTSEDGKWYFLYSLTGSDSKYARTIVEKQDGKWTVTSIVYGNSELKLVPATVAEPEESASSVPESSKSTPAVEEPSTLVCLSQDDYKWFFYDKQPSTVTYDDTYNPSKFTNNVIGNMFFEPDSIIESGLSSSTYDDWAEFASKNSDKQWLFHLKGSVNLAGGSTYANQADIDLSNNRANEVKKELVSRGVPESRIVVENPVEHSDEYGEGYDTIFRRVDVTVDPTCDGTTTDSGR